MNIHRLKFGIDIVRNYRNWQDVFKDHNNVFPIYQRKKYYLRNGIKMETRCCTTDLGTMHRIFVNKENNEFLDELKKGRMPVIIDIGAHIGTFSILAGYKIPQARIISIEPFPDNFNLLIRNIRLNNLCNVKAFKYAISNKEEKRKFYYEKRYSAGCSFKGHDSSLDEKTKSIIVDCITVRHIFAMNKLDNCDLLKIDCEEADFMILKSISGSIFKKIKRIHIEFKPENVKKITQFLDKKGYVCKIEWSTKDYGNIYAQRR